MEKSVKNKTKANYCKFHLYSLITIDSLWYYVLNLVLNLATHKVVHQSIYFGL